MINKAQLFNAYSRYYDLLYRDKDYTGEVDYVESLLVRSGINKGDLLEFGSGTGKHGRLFAERGYDVLGIELSPDMVANSKETEGFKCQQGDIRSLQLGRTYDAVLSLFHVLSYMTSNANVNAVLARAAGHLKLGGLFIFDIWYSPAVYEQRPVVRVKRMSDELVEITRIAEPVLYPNENCVHVNYTIYARELSSGTVQSLSETHPMRHFSLPEIDLLAQANGFTRIAAEEFLTGKPAGEDTWGVCVTLKRI